MNPNTILVDFDGVIHQYSRGWQNGDIYDPPMPGAFDALAAMERAGYRVVIFSTRDSAQIRKWMIENDGGAYPVTNIKEPATAIIDDRGIHFISWPQAVTELVARYPIHRRTRD